MTDLRISDAQTRRTPRDTTAWPDRVLFLLAGALLSLVFISGGSSGETGIGVMLAELLALPVLLYALALTWSKDRLGPARWSIAVLALVVAVPLLQLLPLPAWLWQLPQARLDLQRDLASVGVHNIDYRWSLAPAATLRDLLSLLPAVALFFCALAMPRSAWRGMLWWLIGLAAFSLFLAFAQIGATQDSFLNPFPQFAPAMAGVFANRNHQSITLAIGLVLSLALLLDARRRLERGAAIRFQVGLCVGLIGLFVLALPLVNSRAGVLIAMVGVALVLFTSGALSVQGVRDSRATRWLSITALVLLAIGTYGALAWMQNDADIAGSRWLLTTTTWHLGWANAPLGSGFGSFVHMFEQATQGALMQTGYINNAHNDYVQWWFEGGVLAVLAILAVLAVLATSLHRLLQMPRDSGTRQIGLAALIAALTLLLHSTVDYPLRTPALMTAFALLAGITVATTTHPKTRKSVATI